MGHWTAKYCIIVLCGFALLFPGAALQESFGHPKSVTQIWRNSSQYWNWDNCTKAEVFAEITKVKIDWQGDRNDFEDWDGAGEVEVIYKIWEPGHTGSYRNEYPLDYWKAGKVIGSLKIEDMKFDKRSDSKLIAQQDTEYKKNSKGKWVSDNAHKNYFHVTCVEDLKYLVVALSISEIDGGGYSNENKRDAILGGINVEKKVVEALRDDQVKKFGNPALRLGQEIVEKMGVEIAEELGMKAADWSKSKVAKTIMDEDVLEKLALSVSQETLGSEAGEKVVKKTILKGAGKIGSYVFGGPIGWAWFLFDTVSDLKDLANWIEGDNDFLGAGFWIVPLKEIGTEKKVSFITEIPVTPKVEYHAIKTGTTDPNQPIIVYYQMGHEKSSPVLPSLKQFGTAEVTVKISIKSEKCVQKASSQSAVLSPQAAQFEIEKQNPIHNLMFNSANTPPIHFVDSTTSSIPDWVKKNADWWAQGLISDRDFAAGLGFMVKERIINVENVDMDSQGSIVIDENLNLPKWIRNNAEWWADGQITDDDFKSGIQYMLKEKIISFKEKPVVIIDGVEEQIFVAQKWNQLAMEHLLLIKDYEFNVLDDESKQAWNDYADDQNQDTMKHANELEIAAREAKDAAIQATEILNNARQLSENAKNAAQNKGVPVLEIESKVKDTQQKIDDVKRISSYSDLQYAFFEANQALTKADLALLNTALDGFRDLRWSSVGHKMIDSDSVLIDMGLGIDSAGHEMVVEPPEEIDPPIEPEPTTEPEPIEPEPTTEPEPIEPEPTTEPEPKEPIDLSNIDIERVVADYVPESDNTYDAYEIFPELIEQDFLGLDLVDSYVEYYKETIQYGVTGIDPEQIGKATVFWEFITEDGQIPKDQYAYLSIDDAEPIRVRMDDGKLEYSFVNGKNFEHYTLDSTVQILGFTSLFQNVQTGEFGEGYLYLDGFCDIQHVSIEKIDIGTVVATVAEYSVGPSVVPYVYDIDLHYVLTENIKMFNEGWVFVWMGYNGAEPEFETSNPVQADLVFDSGFHQEYPGDYEIYITYYDESIGQHVVITDSVLKFTIP